MVRINNDVGCIPQIFEFSVLQNMSINFKYFQLVFDKYSIKIHNNICQKILRITKQFIQSFTIVPTTISFLPFFYLKLYMRKSQFQL